MDIKNNLKYINKRIKILQQQTLHIQPKITLIAVTKTFSVDAWKIANKNKLFDIGESKIQETKQKLQEYNNDLINLHFIGHLQTNKVKKAIKLYKTIHTVDSIKIAQKINIECEKINKKQEIFIQINISADPLKYGFKKNEILLAVEKITKMKNIKILGLMTIPQNNLNNAELRRAYKNMRLIKNKVIKDINPNCINISMGMSKDFEIAIQEGATHIRLGTILFGQRN